MAGRKTREESRKRKAFLSLIVAFLIALNTMPVHAANAGWKQDNNG